MNRARGDRRAHHRRWPASRCTSAQSGDAPTLYLHGVPTHSYDWVPFLERTGGIAPDLPGFGRSAKPADFDYSIAGYDRFLEALRRRARASTGSRS